MKVKESEKAVLKLNIQKTKIMASSPIDGDTMETVTDFILGGSKITADEIKRRLLLGTKAMTKLDSIVKKRHYFANKGLSTHHSTWGPGSVRSP